MFPSLNPTGGVVLDTALLFPMLGSNLALAVLIAVGLFVVGFAALGAVRRLRSAAAALAFVAGTTRGRLRPY